MDWKNVDGFTGTDHYIATERSICEALWSNHAAIYIQPEFREPELNCCLLPYRILYLVDRESYAVWRLIQPTEKGGGSFLHMGLARKRDADSYPIYPRKRAFKLKEFVEIFDEHNKSDWHTRLENAPDSPPLKYE